MRRYTRAALATITSRSQTGLRTTNAAPTQIAKNINATLERLERLAVKNISISITDVALRTKLDSLARKAADLNMTMRFDLPVPYSEQNPVALETEEDDLPSGAGKAWLYVEPDGDVLPSQGVNQILGNMLNDPWEKIWKRI